MGTSSSYGGPGGRKPLIPSWLGGGSDGSQPGSPGAPPPNGPPPDVPAAPPNRPPVQPSTDANRFTSSRTSFSQFAKSGGGDRSKLGRSLSHYVSRSSGGPRQAALRMGSSRASGERLLGFLSTAQSSGVREALRALKLENLAGRPIEEVFVGLIDYVCPDSGTVDEGIARAAFIETIADLAKLGIAKFDELSLDQVQTMFELYASHAIEARICNDIGTNAIVFPKDIKAAQQVQAQLQDFIRRSVSDALINARNSLGALTPDRVLAFVDRIYEDTYAILLALGTAEAEK